MPRRLAVQFFPVFPVPVPLTNGSVCFHSLKHFTAALHQQRAVCFRSCFHARCRGRSSATRARFSTAATGCWRANRLASSRRSRTMKETTLER